MGQDIDRVAHLRIGLDWSTILSRGSPASEQATIFGLVFGTIFAVTGRIWMLIIAHAAFDLTALAMIYWGLESDIAYLIFKIQPGPSSTRLQSKEQRDDFRRVDAVKLPESPAAVEVLPRYFRGPNRNRLISRI